MWFHCWLVATLLSITKTSASQDSLSTIILFYKKAPKTNMLNAHWLPFLVAIMDLPIPKPGRNIFENTFEAIIESNSSTSNSRKDGSAASYWGQSLPKWCKEIHRKKITTIHCFVCERTDWKNFEMPFECTT